MKLKERFITVCSGIPFCPGSQGTSKPVRHDDVSALAFLQALTVGHKVGQTKRDHWFSTGHFQTGQDFKQENATGADLISFDFDGADGAGDSDDVVEGFLNDLRSRNIAFTAWTSWSHATKSDEDCSRWRIVFATSRTMTPDEYRIVVDHWVAYFKGHTDNQATRLNTAFGIPLVPFITGREWIKSNLGDDTLCVDVDAIILEWRKNHSGSIYKPTRTANGKGKTCFSNPSKRIIVSDEVLPHDITFHRKDGTVFTQEDVPEEGFLRAIFVPWRQEQNPSGFARRDFSGNVWVYDDATGLKKKVAPFPVPSFPLIKEEEKDGTKYVSEYIAEMTRDWHNTCLALRAPLGSGKSKNAQDIVAQAETALIVVDGRPLARSQAAAFGAAFYEEAVGTIPDKLCTTTHSLWKFHPHRQEGRVLSLADDEIWWDVMVVDEAAGVRSAWTSKTCKGKAWEAMETLFDHMRHSRRVIIQSADMDETEMDWWQNAVGENTQMEWVKVSIDGKPGQRTISLSTDDLVLQGIEQRLEDPTRKHCVMLAYTSDKGCQDLERMYAAKYPNLRIGRVSASNSMTPDIQGLLRNPDRITSEFDLFIYSPSIKGGVDLSQKVDSVWGIYSGGCTPRDFCQMLLRSRNPQNTTIQVSVKETHGEWDIGSRYLTGLALSLAQRTQALIDASMITFSVDYKTGKTVAHDSHLLASWVLCEQETRKMKNNSLKEFVKRCRIHGWNIVDGREEEVEETRKETRQEERQEAKTINQAEYVEDILEAKTLSDDDYQRMDAKTIRTKEEQASLVRTSIANFYEKEVSEDLVETDDHGKYRRKVRTFALLRLWQAGVKNPSVLKDLSADGKDAVEYKQVALRIKMLDKILRMALGKSLELCDGDTFDRSILTERLGEWLSKEGNRRQVREYLGVSCTAATAQKPVQWFLSILRSLGVKATGRRVRTAEGHTRVYTIDLGQIKDLAKAENSRNLRTLIDMRGSSLYRVEKIEAPDWDAILDTLSLAA